jgi:baculoviral IAP repeat-containing protein 7/8
LSVDCYLYRIDMATTQTIQTVDFTKHSYLSSSHFLVNKIEEQKQTIIPPKSISQQEVVVQTKKYSLNETESIRQVRIRGLSHWPHFTPSRESMASAGWFSCNVNDRVLCIYCNTICHEWTVNDDPANVHTRLAPHCPFVLSMPPIERSPKIINDALNEKFEPSHPTMAEISRREATFSNVTWAENLPSIDKLVHAGFFCTGVANTATCFYCNGSLHKWGPNDNPMIEHARWFPNCIYAKHLCGNELYGKIQLTKKRTLTENKFDKDELRRLVAARLDLPVVERLRSQYQLTVIKRCFEDQLRIKNDDFKSDIDLTMACVVLQKQIDIIKGCTDNMIVPSQNQQLKTSSESSKQGLGECLICLTEEKQLACMPCGHLCACVPCGYALRSCPVCRQKIESFMRINS